VRGLIAATESNPTAFKAIKGRLAGGIKALIKQSPSSASRSPSQTSPSKGDHTPYGMVLRLPGLTRSSAIPISAGPATILRE
jgi:hypothetical protein